MAKVLLGGYVLGDGLADFGASRASMWRKAAVVFQYWQVSPGAAQPWPACAPFDSR